MFIVEVLDRSSNAWLIVWTGAYWSQAFAKKLEWRDRGFTALIRHGTPEERADLSAAQLRLQGQAANWGAN